jgi:hypothetical protein
MRGWCDSDLFELHPLSRLKTAKTKRASAEVMAEVPNPNTVLGLLIEDSEVHANATRGSRMRW